MKTKYYRMFYCPTANGMRFSACLAGEGGREPELYLVYISTEGFQRVKHKPDGEAVGNVADGNPVGQESVIQQLILGDLRKETLEEAGRLLRECGAREVVIPKTQGDDGANGLVSYFKAQGAEKVTAVADLYERQAAGFCLRLFWAENQGRPQLLMYLGSRGRNPQEEECVMNVKTAASPLPCSRVVDAGNLNCEMRCLLCQDIVQCKKHNRAEKPYFVDGHLLTAGADMQSCLPGLREAFADVWETIRFVSLPAGGCGEFWTDALTDIGTPGYRQYFLGSREASPEVVKAVSTANPYQSFALYGEDAGLCISGCYAKR